MHQFPELCGTVPISAVNIDDMLAVVKQLTGLFDTAFNAIQRFTFSDHIILCDEDHVIVPQRTEVFLRLERVCIQHTGMISCTFPVSTLVRTLDLNVNLIVILILGVDIEPDISALQVL